MELKIEELLLSHFQQKGITAYRFKQKSKTNCKCKDKPKAGKILRYCASYTKRIQYVENDTIKTFLLYKSSDANGLKGISDEDLKIIAELKQAEEWKEGMPPLECSDYINCVVEYHRWVINTIHKDACDEVKIPGNQITYVALHIYTEYESSIRIYFTDSEGFEQHVDVDID